MRIVHVKHRNPKEYKEQNASVGSAATNKLLRSYLEGAIALTKDKTKSESKQLIKDYFEKADKKELMGASDALAVVEAKEKRLKEKASSASFKTKVNYATDADKTDLSSQVIGGGIAFVATALLAPVVANDPNALSATVLAATASYTAVKVAKGVKLMAAELSASKTPEEKRNAQNYANVKHAQLALKLLKKEIEAPIKAAEKAKRREEIAQLFAAGYGQPSGGLIQAATLKNQKAGR